MCQPRRSCCLQFSLGTVFVILFAFSVSLLAMGTRLRADVGGMAERYASLGGGYSANGGAVGSNCTLTDVRVVECQLPTAGAVGGGFVAVWRRGETGGSVVASPFAMRATRQDADRDTNNYPFNTSLPCAHSTSYSMEEWPTVRCPDGRGSSAFRGACMLDVPLVLYMQQAGFFHAYSGDTLLAIGSLLLVCTVFGASLMVAINCSKIGHCMCCCSCCPADETDVYYSTAAAAAGGKKYVLEEELDSKQN
jgi:hypothetical protein